MNTLTRFKIEAQKSRRDGISTVFRCPFAQSPIDKHKSSITPVELDDLAACMNSDGPKTIALLATDESGNVRKSFALDHDPLPELRTA